MKKICYAIFGAKTKTEETAAEFYAYMRGLYWNVRMNKLIYPEWTTHIEIDVHTFSLYDNIFYALQKEYGITYNVNPETERCKAMLWRMKEIFNPQVTHILCRDADAITTYREALSVQDWENSGMDVQGIADNPAHMAGLMGGMIGFKTAFIKERFGWKSWDEMLSGATDHFSEHGTDQHFLARVIYPNVKENMFAYYTSGVQFQGEARQFSLTHVTELPGVKPALWESNLTCRHIGSAGVVDMETIRFFKRFAGEDSFIKEVGARYPEIFYWTMK